MMKVYLIEADGVREFPVTNETGKLYKCVGRQFRKAEIGEICGISFYGRFKTITTNKDRVNELRGRIINREKKYCFDQIEIITRKIDKLNEHMEEI